MPEEKQNSGSILHFRFPYFIATILLFLIEVSIATVFSDIFFIRAYLGDVLVVMLIYTFIKSFFILNETKLIIGIFIFSCLTEWAQYFNIAEKLGYQKGSLMYIVIGNSFSWIDILCYGVGCVLLYLFSKLNE
ncbi:DUF2809 domain-containing protein [Chryseobacterium sp.]|uniref:ribosomal maturation YjgA family protein n=1 Tax=Chryseobacterium sp. TaxID=1871047 RepID=UPI0025B97B99|nr:DUF2809 domain-containing protein [Chryseobacterium sp.]